MRWICSKTHVDKLRVINTFGPLDGSEVDWKKTRAGAREVFDERMWPNLCLLTMTGAMIDPARHTQ